MTRWNVPSQPGGVSVQFPSWLQYITDTETFSRYPGLQVKLAEVPIEIPPEFVMDTSGENETSAFAGIVRSGHEVSALKYIRIIFGSAETMFIIFCYNYF